MTKTSGHLGGRMVLIDTSVHIFDSSGVYGDGCISCASGTVYIDSPQGDAIIRLEEAIQ